MTPDAPIADPSPAPETAKPVDPSDFLSSMSDSARQKYQLTGEFPTDAPATPETPATPKDSPSPKVEEPLPSTEEKLKAASEPAKKSKAQGAEERVQELLAERAVERQRAERAERELHELRTKQQKPEEPKPVAATPAEKFLPYVEWLEKNPQGSYEDYVDSRSAFSSEQAFKRLQAEDTSRREQEQRTQTVQSRAIAHGGRLKTAITAEPDFLSKLSPDVAGLNTLDTLKSGEMPTALHYVGQEILLSDKGPQLMRYLSDHPEEMTTLTGLTTVDGIIRRMGYLSARLDTPPLAPKGRTVTGAPLPPSSPVGGKAVTDAADPSVAAATAGDFRGYMSAKNAEEIAAHKR